MSDPFAHLPSVREWIRHESLHADKRFGQHFLTDERILQRIVALAGAVEGHHVIEVGPGPTALTRALLHSPAASVTAIEVDPRFLPLLEQLRAATAGRLHILHRDALSVDLAEASPAPRMVVANLPYNVGTPLLVQWLRGIATCGPGFVSRLVLMFQKEVAERIWAAPGEDAYGRLAVLAQWLCTVQPGFDLPPGAFSPPPKVSSSVVVLTPRALPLFQAQFETVERVVAAAFGQRRKMLRGALKSLGDAQGHLARAGIDPTRRAETLSLDEFGALIATYDA
jgi:16S rRNA (adenine1518-N6/adenine1519-N6)-dimethyltransferase